jgi:hypothetical protein
MTAKVTLIGQPQGLRIEKDIVTFRIITGPASNTAPKGLTLLPVSRAERGRAARRKATAYVVQCAQRQYNRGRASERDKSELVIEGYQEPRIGEDGKSYIAVVALSASARAVRLSSPKSQPNGWRFRGHPQRVRPRYARHGELEPGAARIRLQAVVAQGGFDVSGSTELAEVSAERRAPAATGEAIG